MKYLLLTIGDFELLKGEKGRCRQELHNSYTDACNRLKQIWTGFKKGRVIYPYSHSIIYYIIEINNLGKARVLDIGRMKEKGSDRVMDKIINGEDGYTLLRELLPWTDKNVNL